jgi:hypothetical protein
LALAGEREGGVSWRRVVALGIPLAVLVFAVGVVVGLEVRRGPDWRLELDEYVARERASGEVISVEAVVRARKPWNFAPAMGNAERESGIAPSFPPQAVRCALLIRQGEPDRDGEAIPVRQVVFLVHHSDAPYRVGWLAYEGPEEPFGPELTTHLKRVGCDLGLD